VWIAGGQITQRGHAAGSDAAGSDLERLLGKVAAGDHAAFEAVCHRVDAAVYSAVCRVVRDPSQSEEVAQDVLGDRRVPFLFTYHAALGVR